MSVDLEALRRKKVSEARVYDSIGRPIDTRYYWCSESEWAAILAELERGRRAREALEAMPCAEWSSGRRAPQNCWEPGRHWDSDPGTNIWPREKWCFRCVALAEEQSQ